MKQWLIAASVVAVALFAPRLDARAGDAAYRVVDVIAGPDGAIFDSARRLAYVPCNDGTLTIFQLDRAGRPEPLAVVKTAKGARTAALDAATGKLYLPTADFTEDSNGEPVRKPGTFRVIVVAPR